MFRLWRRPPYAVPAVSGLLYLVISASTSAGDITALVEKLREAATAAGCTHAIVEMVQLPGQPLDILVTCKE